MSGNKRYATSKVLKSCTNMPAATAKLNVKNNHLSFRVVEAADACLIDLSNAEWRATILG